MPSIGCYQYRELILNRIIIEEPVKCGPGRPAKVSNLCVILRYGLTYTCNKAKLNPSGQGGHEKTIKNKQAYRSGWLPLVERRMMEDDLVWAREEFSMEMIKIRTEQRLANLEDSDIEAEELEAVNEAEAVVLEHHNNNLICQMEGMEEKEKKEQDGEQLQSPSEASSELDYFNNANDSVLPGLQSTTPVAVDASDMDLDTFETVLHFRSSGFQGCTLL